MIDIQSILKDIEYKDYTFSVIEENDIQFLQLSFEDDCACRDNGRCLHYCRKWRISPNITKSEFVQMAFTAVMAAEEHEIREKFKYKKAAVFGPHFDVESRVEEYNAHKFDMRTNSVIVNIKPKVTLDVNKPIKLGITPTNFRQIKD
jgi:hypothetical protein